MPPRPCAALAESPRIRRGGAGNSLTRSSSMPTLTSPGRDSPAAERGDVEMAKEKLSHEGKSSNGQTGGDARAAQVQGTHPWVAEAQGRVRFGVYGIGSPEWSADRDWAL